MFPITKEMVQRIQNYMLKNTVSKSEMAQKLGITTPALTNILNGKSHSIRKDTFEKYKQLFPNSFSDVMENTTTAELRPWQIVLRNFIDGYDPLLQMDGTIHFTEDNFAMLLGLLSYLCTTESHSFIDSETPEDALKALFETTPNLSITLSPSVAGNFFSFLLKEIQEKNREEHR